MKFRIPAETYLELKSKWKEYVIVFLASFVALTIILTILQLGGPFVDFNKSMIFGFFVSILVFAFYLHFREAKIKLPF